MQIKIESNTINKKLPKNKYQIKMNTYWGDADGYEKYKFLVDPEKIEQVVLEILFLDNQFQSGRGGCREMYDQFNYFNSESVHTEGYFTWLEAYPYHGDIQQNYTLSDFTITYFDNNSLEHKVSVDETQAIIDDIKKMNKKFKMSEYSEWDNIDSSDEKFHHYHKAVISYIEAYILNKKIDSKQETKKQIKI